MVHLGATALLSGATRGENTALASCKLVELLLGDRLAQDEVTSLRHRVVTA